MRRLVTCLVICAGLTVCQDVFAQASDDIGGPYALTNQDGVAVTDKTYLGKPLLMYFGFTSCPDVCPTDLVRMQRIVRRVEALGGPSITPVFVTVDPERDTPMRMKDYTEAFGRDFVGLTGTPAQIAQIAEAYHVYYKKVPYGDRGHYTMDHSSFAFLVDRKGRYVDHFGRQADEEQVAQQVVALIAKTGN